MQRRRRRSIVGGGARGPSWLAGAAVDGSANSVGSLQVWVSPAKNLRLTGKNGTSLDFFLFFFCIERASIRLECVLYTYPDPRRCTRIPKSINNWTAHIRPQTPGLPRSLIWYPTRPYKFSPNIRIVRQPRNQPICGGIYGMPGRARIGRHVGPTNRPVLIPIGTTNASSDLGEDALWRRAGTWSGYLSRMTRQP